MPLPLQFRLTPADRAGFSDRPFFQRFTATAAAPGITNGYTVPRDQVLVLNSYFVDLIAGAAQTVISYSVSILDSGGVTICILNANIPAAPPARLIEDRQFNNLWIPPGSSIVIGGTFSAGAAANTASIDIAGQLVAHGNWPAL